MERSAITPALASRLVATQFPQWASLPVYPVEVNWHDNITFRLGESMSVRLPSDDDHVPQVTKEHRWLPELARHLPLPIPQPLAMGAPGCGYPWPWSWSVYQWLDGEPAATAHITDLPQFAADLAGFLATLYKIDTSGGPPAGYETCYFGVPLTHWDSQTRESITILPRQPAGLARTSQRSHRFRHRRHRGPRLRHRHRLDVRLRWQPRRLQGTAASQRGHLGPRPRLGALEGSDHSSARPR